MFVCVCVCSVVFALPLFVCRCRSLLLPVALPRLLVFVVGRCRRPLLLVVVVLSLLFCRCPCRPGLFVPVSSLSLVAVAAVAPGPWSVYIQSPISCKANEQAIVA